MKYNILFAIAFLLIGCGSTTQISNYDSDPNVQLARILQEEVAASEGKLAGVSLTVISPELEIDFSGAAGYDSVTKEQQLSEDQPFRIASLTKTFVAAAIVRLNEKGLLKLDDPIANYISDAHKEIIRADGYDPTAITIKQCLMHTSGLFDYAVGNGDYIQEASKDPLKRWTRTEQLQWAMDHGDPMGQPGEAYHYSDTGYILLGETIEQLTKKGLAEGLRELLKFDVLGMDATWLESLEARPTGLLSDVKRYMGTMDATLMDNSVDLYGGGGLYSTTRDLADFLQALFNDRVYEDGKSLPSMLMQSIDGNGGKALPQYRLGLEYVRGKKTKTEAFFHNGFWGTVFMHFPPENCSIAMNNTNDVDHDTLQRVVDYILWLAKR
jgi:D-alanyl-D-alanine carboxypeptidase